VSRWRWVAVLAGPVWWMMHVTGVSALASGACGHHAYVWLAHGLTVATCLPTALGIAVSARLSRRTPEGTIVFVGWFGVVVGALSLLLILLEESYIWTVRVCG
jgi:heme exporter protein D